MFSDEGMDTGDMLLKDTVSIDENMTFIELHDKLSELGVGTLGKTLEKIKAGNIERIKQNNNEASLAPLKPLRNKEICKIDWNKSSKTIHDLIRGLTPYPGAFTFYKGKRMKVFNSSYFACPTHKHRPGEIVEINKCDMSVATGDGLLVINDIQLENCRKICIEECGHNFMEGEKLE
jgi:methionyl-tRNA formyltransferase